MARLFDEHIKRYSRSLNGAWSFKLDSERIGKSEKWYRGLTDAVTVNIPSVWNTELGLLGYEGVCWYEKSFYFEGNLRLNFGAVMTECDVWFDGEYIGNHYGGFCEFSFIIPDVAPGEHRLTLMVDNSFDKQSIPQARVDWYHYDGIIRDVEAERLVGIAALNHRFEYNLDKNLENAATRAIINLYNSENKAVSTKVTYKIGDVTVYSEDLTLSAHEYKTVSSSEVKLDKVKLWDIGEPNLYTVRIETDTDDLYDKVGFRKVEVSPEGVILNGRLIEIRGVNRHEEHAEFGFAFPPSLMKRDLDIIFDLGCNAIRGSHYPPSRRFMDMVDEAGLLYWCEIPMWGWGFSPEALGDPVVIERGAQMHRDMLKYYFNHPSIIIWGMHNEIHSECEVAVPLTKKYYEILKADGGNRIVTYATDKPLKDLCLEYCDLISINAYFGWYEGDMYEWENFFEKVKHRRAALGMEHKPVIMSEFGAAAIYGHHTFDNVHFTEEYQANVLEHALKLFHNDPMCCGFYIWQFCDIRTCLEAGLTRARGFNNKGILNEQRKPKAAYYKVKELYRKFAE